MDATFQETKAGKGYKIVVDGQWLYASKASLLAVVDGRKRSCLFREITDDEPSSE